MVKLLEPAVPVVSPPNLMISGSQVVLHFRSPDAQTNIKMIFNFPKSKSESEPFIGKCNHRQ